MSETVQVDLKLEPELKASLRKAARASGVSVNEYICDALTSRVRQTAEWNNSGEKNYTPHGGKHKFGKSTGYEVTEDGRYYPAPLWVDRFEQLFAERAAISSLANLLIVTAQERLITVEKEVARAKQELTDDLGLDPAKEWTYYGAERCLRLSDPPKENE